ncbi:MAG: efflux RND transporter permease subunit, partial [Victivallales bacterium]|nr:efflux RND transporter permease subunit [Victivallales bacterium]
MNLAEVSIKRPVFISMIIMAVILLGVTALQRLPVEMFPEADIPYAMVITIYPGASPEEIESQITDKLEDELSALSDLKQFRSTSAESMSSIIMEFQMGADLDAKIAEVRDKIDLVKGNLPDDAEDPIIMQIDISSVPILFAAVSAPRSELEIRKATDDIVKKQLEKVSGVASIGVSGGSKREIHVNVDRDKLFGYNLSILQVIQALGRDNIDFPAGKIKKGTDESLVRLMGEYV